MPGLDKAGNGKQLCGIHENLDRKKTRDSKRDFCFTQRSVPTEEKDKADRGMLIKEPQLLVSYED